MSGTRNRRASPRHVEAQLRWAIAADVPGEVGIGWRAALASEPCWDRSRWGAAGVRLLRPLRVSAIVFTAMVALLISASLVSPTVALYAGSLPGVGPVLSALRLDRGLWIAYELGFAIRVNREVTDGEVVFRVDSLVADNVRTVMDYEVWLPADLWEQMSQGEEPRVSPWAVALWDQWGKLYGWRGPYLYRSDDMLPVGNMVAYRGRVEFRPLELRSRRMTAGLMVYRPGTEYSSVDEILKASERLAIRLTFPSDFGPAASRSHVYYPNASDEVDGVKATLYEVTAGATATRYRVSVDGLAGERIGLLSDQVTLATQVTREWAQTSWSSSGELDMLVPTPLVGQGSTTLSLAVYRVREAGLTIALERTPDGNPVPVQFELRGLVVTLDNWKRSGDRLELSFSGEGASGWPVEVGLHVAVPGGDEVEVLGQKTLIGRSAYFYCPSRQPGVWLHVPDGAPEPTEIIIVAVREPLSRWLELTFEIP